MIRCDMNYSMVRRRASNIALQCSLILVSLNSMCIFIPIFIPFLIHQALKIDVNSQSNKQS